MSSGPAGSDATAAAPALRCGTDVVCTLSGMTKLNERWDFRVAAGTDRLVRRAADSADKTLTDFVLDAAVLEAERVLADRRDLELAPEQWARFVEILDRPPRANPGLKRLFSRPSVFVQK